MAAVLSNQKIIDEINAIQDSFIQTRPKMEMNAFKPTRFGAYNLGDQRGGSYMRGGGSPAFQKHPLSYGNVNGNTLHPDPLFSGIVYQKYKNTGGALLREKMPLTEDTDSESESEGGYFSESSEGEDSSEDEGEIGGDMMDNIYKKAKPIAMKIAKKAMPIALHSGRGVKGVRPLSGGSITDIAKKAGSAIYKVITSGEAKGLAEGAIKTGIIAVLSTYFGPAGTATGAFGLNEIDKLRYKFGDPYGHKAQMKKESEQGSGFKETAASIKKRLASTRDAIYRAMQSDEAKYLGAAATTLLIGAIIAKMHSRYSMGNDGELVHHREPNPETVRQFLKHHQAPTPIIHKIEQILEMPPLRPSSPITHPDTPPEYVNMPNFEQEITPAVGYWDVYRHQKTLHPEMSKPQLQAYMRDHHLFSNPVGDFPPGYFQVISDNNGRGLKKKGGKIVKVVGKKRGETVRGAVVSEIMRKHGMNLGQASKYVKQHNLY